MIGIIIAFTIGAMFGAGVMCCCIAAGRADREMENNDNDTYGLHDRQGGDSDADNGTKAGFKSSR
ncbi:MAG TPA: DUF3789 domain-containing protein [Candidatus Ornithomonoglobus merdipullorum]|uniref:DUF3789 domain-containing protein n=1 Tax=Candidatus Ornithomonoglobus merdipullorum TaxID=2840895 RepID=A0A9D1MCI8_9FIRM|nr:DUF3789 domain-containing protein [Candidatus Ornithomonoglobus merdipullorum]